jgi:hypothetical protein
MGRAAAIALCLAAVTVPCPVGASCVAPGGAGGCFATIQAAIDAAVPDEVIDVAAGSYAERVVIGGSARLTLRGAGSGSTEIDGAGGGPVGRGHRRRRPRDDRGFDDPQRDVALRGRVHVPVESSRSPAAG